MSLDHHGAAGMPAVHEDAGHGTDEGQRQQEEYGHQGDGARGSVHAKRHLAEDGVKRQEIAEDADQGRQPQLAESGDGEGLAHGELRSGGSCHTVF